MERLSDPSVAVPLAAMAVIIFVVVFRVIANIEILGGGARLPVALCVTVLATMGIDSALVKLVIGHYTALGVAILIGVAALIRARWRTTQKRDRR